MSKNVVSVPNGKLMSQSLFEAERALGQAVLPVTLSTAILRQASSVAAARGALQQKLQEEAGMKQTEEQAAESPLAPLEERQNAILQGVTELPSPQVTLSALAQCGASLSPAALHEVLGIYVLAD